MPTDKMPTKKVPTDKMPNDLLAFCPDKIPIEVETDKMPNNKKKSGQNANKSFGILFIGILSVGILSYHPKIPMQLLLF